MTREEWAFVEFTARMAVLSTVLVIPVGVAIGWWLARVHWRGKAIIETLRLPLRGNDGAISLILSCSEELADRNVPPTDAACEIITIIDQRFLDIGAGSPPRSALEGAATS